MPSCRLLLQYCVKLSFSLSLCCWVRSFFNAFFSMLTSNWEWRWSSARLRVRNMFFWSSIYFCRPLNKLYSIVSSLKSLTVCQCRAWLRLNPVFCSLLYFRLNADSFRFDSLYKDAENTFLYSSASAFIFLTLCWVVVSLRLLIKVLVAAAW